MSEWVRTKDRVPNEEECKMGLVGIVNGMVGGRELKNKWAIVRYDPLAEFWFAPDYDINDFADKCSVDMWYAVPKPQKER